MVADPAIELKPRGIMELFDQALRLYRNNFLKFVGIIAVAEVPIQLVQLLLNVLFYQGAVQNTGSTSSPYFTAQSIGTTVVSLVVLVLTYIFVSGLATAALTRAISGSYLGEEVSIGGAYQKIKGYWGTLLVALLLAGLLAVLMLIWAIVPCIGWVTGFGMLFFVTLVISPLIAPIIVIEHSTSSNAIRRGWELARRRFWWLTGFFLLLMLFNLLVVQGPVQIVTVAIQSYLIRGASSANLASTTALQSISSSVLTMILSLLYLPLASTCATLAYFDLRVRQEGFDLALMSTESESTPVNALELASQAPATPTGSLITWKEMGYFALTSLIISALYAVFVGFYMVLALAFMSGGL